MSGFRRFAIILTILLLALAGGGYFAGKAFFRTRFFPGTMINGRDCSFYTVREAEEMIDREVKIYALTIHTLNNGVEGITAEDLGMSYHSDGTVQKFMDLQTPDSWFLHLQDHAELSVANSVTIRDNFLELAVDGLKCMQPENITYPSDAYVEESGDDYRIVPEVVGNELDRDKVLEVVRGKALRWITEADLVEEGCYKKPQVTSDSPVLHENIDNLRLYKETLITYDFADHVETVEWEQIEDWLYTDPEGYIVPDPEKVHAFLHELGEKTNTTGEERSFLTYDDRQATIVGGDLGWIIDEDQETKELIRLIKAGTVEVREPIYLYTAGSRSGVNDIGSTYIEIDLEFQRLVYYQAGTPMIDTDIVSGFPHEEGSQTPVGCYFIKSKESPGYVEDGTNSGTVQYLLKFTENLGISDAPWRTDYGGDEFFWNGTDGSVEVPGDWMASLYEYVEVGTPVVIYDLGSEIGPSQEASVFSEVDEFYPEEPYAEEYELDS